mgnify:CR=1 FL=1
MDVLVTTRCDIRSPVWSGGIRSVYKRQGRDVFVLEDDVIRVPLWSRGLGDEYDRQDYDVVQLDYDVVQLDLYLIHICCCRRSYACGLL